MQGEYEKEAKEVECLEMLTLGRCEERTYENGPANYPLAAITHSAIYGNLRKIGATLSPLQCLHH